ncbi:MAG: hypothetical protein ACLTTW_06930 [Coprobacter sp.]
MLQITKTTITREAVKETSNGLYKIEFTTSEGIITVLKCTITKNENVLVPAVIDDKETVQSMSQSIYIGNINLFSGNQINITMPYQPDIAKYLNDFDNIIAEITSSPGNTQENTNAPKNES